MHKLLFVTLALFLFACDSAAPAKPATTPKGAEPTGAEAAEDDGDDTPEEAAGEAAADEEEGGEPEAEPAAEDDGDEEPAGDEAPEGEDQDEPEE